MKAFLNVIPEKLVEEVKRANITFQDDNYTEFEPILMIYDDHTTIEQFAQMFNLETSKDPFYYRKIESSLDHLLFKWNNQWIKSRRQLVITSEDCLSTIHLVMTSRSYSLNVFQRSSNIDNALIEDIAFLCSWITSRGNQMESRDVKIFSSIPHTFGNNLSKVENGH